MRFSKTIHFLLFSAFAFLANTSCSSESEPVAGVFPSGVDHSDWDTLVKKYVNDRGLVDYKAWKGDSDDMKLLNEYLSQFAAESGKADGDELGASAVNAYNAFAIRTILKNYPVKSIEDIDGAFTKKSHDVGGRKLSLDEIEKGGAIPAIGARAHAIVVCCAKSCPPLQAKAYTAENLDSLADKASEAWLSRPDLNDFGKGKERIAISKIFKWYEKDFEKDGGVKGYLKKHAPENAKGRIEGAEIEYLDYDWELNGQ